MADGVSVFDSAVRKKNSVLPFVIRLFTDRSSGCLLPLVSILWMHALQPFFPGREALFRIETIYAMPFLGEMCGLSPCHTPGPTPRVREPLRFRQIRLALLQLLFLYFQGLDSESPINKGRQQSQPEDGKGDGDNSGGPKCGDAYGMRQVRRHVKRSETGGGHACVMHDRDGGTHHDGSS